MFILSYCRAINFRLSRDLHSSVIAGPNYLQDTRRLSCPRIQSKRPVEDTKAGRRFGKGESILVLRKGVRVCGCISRDVVEKQAGRWRAQGPRRVRGPDI